MLSKKIKGIQGLITAIRLPHNDVKLIMFKQTFIYQFLINSQFI